MWSALYGAKSGKIYVGLCTHAEAAHFYEFDPETEKMRHIVDLTELHGERGEGINTNGKIHVRMGEDNDGNIYFGSEEPCEIGTFVNVKITAAKAYDLMGERV